MSAMGVLDEYNAHEIKVINENEDHIDKLADHVDNYLIRLSPHMPSGHGSDMLNYYIQCFGEFERIGDHAVNLTENAQEFLDRSASLSPTAHQELMVLREVLGEILDYTYKRVGVVLLEHVHRVHHTRAGETRHGGDGLTRARERDGGRGEELFIEQRKLVVDIFTKAHIVLDELARELFKLAAHRQQHDGRSKTEHRVHIRDAAGGKRLVPQGIEHTERVQQHQPLRAQA